MIVIENKYEIGAMVYLVTDADQSVRIVTAFKVYKQGEVIYQLSCGIISSDHYEFEISSEKTFANV